MSTAVEVIRSQINPMVLMSLGASELVSSEANEGRPALAFWARILPFNAKGKRLSRPAKMRVYIELTPADLYAITVVHSKAGEYGVHFEMEGVGAEDLNRVLLSLDSDGDRE